jgi:uncharacterized NAD(P)/FAD-binding protein YdhS
MPPEPATPRRTLAIVGAGFSGSLLALHALRSTPAGTDVLLIERARRFGQGLAYGTGNANHLLNVPAAGMSAFPDRPTDFLDWLQTQPAWQGATATSFVPRHAFGAYVRELLTAELRRPDIASRLVLVRGTAEAIVPDGDRLAIRLDRDRTRTADLAVLATGNFPPAPPRVADPTFYDSPLFRADPWDPAALEGLDPKAPVLLIGTGLTAVDMVIALLDHGHTGPITALSRRGLLPKSHRIGPRPPPGDTPSFPARVLPLLRTLRAAARAAEADGGSWHGVVDSLRPFTQDLWQALPPADQAAFLRHLRPWWDVHRHRMAPAVADRIAAARAAFQLGICAGRIQSFEPRTPERVEVRFRARARDGGAQESVVVARVINCSGPSCDYDRTTDPLLRDLLDRGLARPDPLKLGLDVTATCALHEASGAVSRRMFAVGPITKGRFWEMTAVPDLRRQCDTLATHLASLLMQMPGGAS